MISPESIWNLLWVNENFTHYSCSQVFPVAGGIFPLFLDCRGVYKIMGPKLETGRVGLFFFFFGLVVRFKYLSHLNC